MNKTLLRKLYDDAMMQANLHPVDKFAELIIRECIAISDNIAQLDQTQEETKVAIKISNKIAERFGVENEQEN